MHHDHFIEDPLLEISVEKAVIIVASRAREVILVDHPHVTELTFRHVLESLDSPCSPLGWRLGGCMFPPSLHTRLW